MDKVKVKEVTLKYTFETGGWGKEWQVRYGDTLLLHTQNEEQAREAYERYKANPPKLYKMPEVIF